MIKKIILSVALLMFVVFQISVAQETNFKVAVEQDNKTLNTKKGVIKLDKKPLVFVVDMPALQSGESQIQIRYIATLDKQAFKQFDEGKTINSLLGVLYQPYAMDIKNANQFVVVSDDGYGLWYYTADENDHLFTSLMLTNNRVIGKVKIKEFYIKNNRRFGSQTFSLADLPERNVYFCFELFRNNQKVARQSMKLQFRK